MKIKHIEYFKSVYNVRFSTVVLNWWIRTMNHCFSRLPMFECSLL